MGNLACARIVQFRDTASRNRAFRGARWRAPLSTLLNTIWLSRVYIGNPPANNPVGFVCQGGCR